MRRAALSRNALRLPASPSATLEIVRGRQQVVRHGIFFTVIGKWRRAVYAQLDGEVILADECTCLVNWPEDGGRFGLSFEIRRSSDCPIDEHQRLALQQMQCDFDDEGVVKLKVLQAEAKGSQTVPRGPPGKPEKAEKER